MPTGDQNSPWEDLVVSILSVNQYSLEKTHAVAPLLRQGGLLSPENLSRWELEEIVARLKAAGCDRGRFMTKLFAVRLASLGMAVESRGIAICGRILSSNDPAAISDLLLPINGVGPKVLRNFFVLRGIRED
jgi:hypothetical protein